MWLVPDTSCTLLGEWSQALSNTFHAKIPIRQHHVVPERDLVSEITHVALAFMSSAAFNEAEPSSWPLFTTIDKARSQFAPGTAIMVAIGGWGDQDGFDVAAATDSSRKLFARNVERMVNATGAHGKPMIRF